MSILFPSEDGLDRGISMMAVDVGYAAQEVYGWIRKPTTRSCDGR